MLTARLEAKVAKQFRARRPISVYACESGAGTVNLMTTAGHVVDTLEIKIPKLTATPSQIVIGQQTLVSAYNIDVADMGKTLRFWHSTQLQRER